MLSYHFYVQPTINNDMFCSLEPWLWPLEYISSQNQCKPCLHRTWWISPNSEWCKGHWRDENQHKVNVPEVESQSTRRSGGECDERLRIRRLRIPVIDNSVRDLDVGMKIPFLKSSSIENGLFIMYLPIVSDYMRWQISARHGSRYMYAK